MSLYYHVCVFTSTAEQVLQQHQVHGTGATRRTVALSDADVRTAAVVTGTRVGCWREETVVTKKAYAFLKTHRRTSLGFLNLDVVFFGCRWPLETKTFGTGAALSKNISTQKQFKREPYVNCA